MEVDESEKIGNQNVLNENLYQNALSPEKERKITQTDHLNKQLLNAFLQRINTEQLANQPGGSDEGETTDGKWSVEESIDTEQREISSYVLRDLHVNGKDIETNVLVVGISGPTNSGKTTLTSNLHQIIPGSTHICQDKYFHLPGDPRLTWVEEVQHNNWELLTALDMEAMTKDVKAWKEKQLQKDPIENSVLLVEGFTIFNYQPLSELFDKRYFIVTSKEVCYKRRLERHYNPPDVPGYFEKVVWPHYVQFFNEIKDRSDIVFLEENLSQEEKFMKVNKDIENSLQNS